MKKFHMRSHRTLLAGLVLTLAVLLLVGWVAFGGGLRSADASPNPGSSPRDDVLAAWQRVQARGSYRFSGDVVQVTVPAATLANIGRASSEERLHLEGQTDLASQAMALQLWSDSTMGGGSTLIPESGIQVEVADGKTRARRGAGPWEEMAGITEGYAPQGDFMAYLAAMKDVTAHPPETRAGIVFTRYTFAIDGPLYAAYARDQLQHALSARGELPSGLELSVSPYLQGMTGDGELWLSEDGLPLRQILRLRYPAQRDERVNAEITANFSNFAPLAPASLAFTDPAMFWQALKPILNSLGLLVLAGAFGASVDPVPPCAAGAGRAGDHPVLPPGVHAAAEQRAHRRTFLQCVRLRLPPRKNRAPRTMPPAR